MPRYIFSTSARALVFVAFCSLLFVPVSALAQQDGAAVLKAMSSIDDQLAMGGVTIEGTKIWLPAGGSRCDPVAKWKWKFTCVSGNKIAFDEEVVEVLKWEDYLPGGSSIPQPDDTTFMHMRRLSFLSPEATGMYDFIGTPSFKPGVWVWPAEPKKVHDNVGSGSIRLHRPNPLTYLAFLDLPLLLVGRGYAKHIESITSVEALANGRLSVKAKGKPFYARATKWELVVEPAAAYLVRSATYYVDDSERTIEKPRYVITTSGLHWFGSLALPEKFEQRDPLYEKEQPFLKSGTVISASLTGDEQFFKETVDMFQPPFPVSTDIEDNRMDPPMHLTIPAGEVLDINAVRENAKMVNDIKLSDMQVTKKPPEPQVTPTPTPSPKQADQPNRADTAVAQGKAKSHKLIAVAVSALAIGIGIAYSWGRRKENRD